MSGCAGPGGGGGFTPLRYEPQGNRLVMQNLGFRGVAMTIPEGFVVSTTPGGNGALVSNAEEFSQWAFGTRYYLYEPIYLRRGMTAILVQPYLLLHQNQAFFEMGRDQRRDYLNFEMFGRYKDTCAERGDLFAAELLPDARAYLRISNLGSANGVAVERRHVLGNGSEVILLNAVGPESERAELLLVLREMIASLDFFPDDPNRS